MSHPGVYRESSPQLFRKTGVMPFLLGGLLFELLGYLAASVLFRGRS